MKHFLSCEDRTKEELLRIIKKATEIKRGNLKPDFSGKLLTLIFANPSLRTRLSFANGFQKFGGNVSVLDAGNSWNFEFRENIKMDGISQEHAKEAIKVISRYSDVIGIRDASLATKDFKGKEVPDWEQTKKQDHLPIFAKYSEKPVVNMESNVFHPCQALADSQTILENTSKKLEDINFVLSWAPHPKPLPLATPHSQLLLPAKLGMKVSLACPQGFELDEEILGKVKKHCPNFQINNNQEILKKADFVVAKSWASIKYFGDWDLEAKERKKYENWTIAKEKLGNDTKFMHCLPIRRNVVTSDEVIDSKNSLIIDEAENRMWSQIALLDEILS